MYNNWEGGPPRVPMMGHGPPGPPNRMGMQMGHQFHPNAPGPGPVMQRGPRPGQGPGGPMFHGGNPHQMMGPRMMGPRAGGHGPGMPQAQPGGDGRPSPWGGHPPASSVPFQHQHGLRGPPPGPRPVVPAGPPPLVMGGDQGPGSLPHSQRNQQDEALKFRSLQDQAKQWQATAPDRQMAEVEQQRQAMEEQWKNYNNQMQAYQQQYQQWYQAQEAALANVKLEDLQEKKKNCEKQLTDWKTQFDQWVEQHKQHPNKQQFDQYQNQWKSWQTQMESMVNSLDMQIKIKDYSLQKEKSDKVPTMQTQMQPGNMQKVTRSSSGPLNVTPDVRTTTAPVGNMTHTPQGSVPSGPGMGPGIKIQPVGPGTVPKVDFGPGPRGPTGMGLDQAMKGPGFGPGKRGPNERGEEMMTRMGHKGSDLDKKFPFPFPGDFPFPDDMDSFPFPADMKLDDMFPAGMNPDDFPFPFPDFPMPPDFMKSEEFPFPGEMKPDMFPDMSPKEMFAFMSKMESNLEKTVREEMAQTFGEDKPSPSAVESRQVGMPPVLPKDHPDSSQRIGAENATGFSSANDGSHGIDRSQSGLGRRPMESDRIPFGINRGPENVRAGPPGVDGTPPGMNRGPPLGDKGPSIMDRPHPGMNPLPPAMNGGYPAMGRGLPSNNRAPPGMNVGPPGMARGPSGMDRGPPGINVDPFDIRRGPPGIKREVDESLRGALTGPPGDDDFTPVMAGTELKSAIAPPGMDDGPPGEEAPYNYKPPYFSPPKGHKPPGVDIAPPGIDDQHLRPAQDEPLPPGMEPLQFSVKSDSKSDIAPPGLDELRPPGEEQHVLSRSDTRPLGEEQHVLSRSDTSTSKAGNQPDDAGLSEFERKQNLPLFPPKQTKGLTRHCIPITGMVQDSLGSSSFVSSRQTLIGNPLAGFDTLESEKVRKKLPEHGAEQEKATGNTAKSKSITSSVSAAKDDKETEKKSLAQIKTEPKPETSAKDSIHSSRRMNIVIKSLKPSDEETSGSSALQRTLPPPPDSSSKAPAPASIGELFKRNSGSVGFNKDTKATLRSYRKAAEEDEEDEEHKYELKKELKDSKVKKDSKGRDDSLRPAAPSPPRGYRLPDRKKRNSQSPDRRKHKSISKSPDRRRKNSRSPPKKRKDSRSPGRRGSRSPNRKQYSRSPPGRSKHSRSPSRGRSNRSPDRRKSGSNQKDRPERYRDKYSREPRGRDRRSAESSQPNTEAFEKLRELLYDTLVRQPDEKQPQVPPGERRYGDERQLGDRSRSPYFTRRENYYPQAERPRMRVPPPPPPHVRPIPQTSDIPRGQPYGLQRDSTGERSLEKPGEKEPSPDKDRQPPMVFEYEHKESSRPAFDVVVREPLANSLSSAVVVDVVDYNHGQIRQPKIRVLDGKELMEENERILVSSMTAAVESLPPVTNKSDNVSKLQEDEARVDPVPSSVSQMPHVEQYSQQPHPPKVSQYEPEPPQPQDEYFQEEQHQEHYQHQPPLPPAEPLPRHRGQQHEHQQQFSARQLQPGQLQQQFPQPPVQGVEQYRPEGSYMQHMMSHLQRAPPPPPPQEKVPKSYQPEPPPLPPPSSEASTFPSWSAAPPPPPLESYQPSPGSRSRSPGRDQAGERGKRGQDDMFLDSPHKDFYSDTPLQPQQPPPKVKKREVVAVTDILDPPNREKRPPKICVILRGVSHDSNLINVETVLLKTA